MSRRGGREVWKREVVAVERLSRGGCGQGGYGSGGGGMEAQMERTSHAFDQLESKWRQGRGLLIGWSDGTGDMAATGRGRQGGLEPGTRSDRSMCTWENGFLWWCGFGLCGARSSEVGEKKLVRAKGVKKGDELPFSAKPSSFLPSFLPLRFKVHQKYLSPPMGNHATEVVLRNSSVAQFPTCDYLFQG